VGTGENVEASAATAITDCASWSVAGAVSACYDCSATDAGDVVGVEVETGEVHGGHCDVMVGVDGVIGEVERLHKVGVVVLESKVARYAR
jgi:hypothetical protein